MSSLPPSITIHAPAKINLGLDVLGRRPDGYHELRMVMQTVNLCDTLTLTLREDDDILLTCDDPALAQSDPEQNLCVRAARLLQREGHLRTGVSIGLQKRIPSEAGLGGGSSDAAAVLVGLNRLCGMELQEETLQALGLLLGADVPFCIRGGTALAEGAGEILTPLPDWEGLPILLAKPAQGASTKEIFERIDACDDLPHPVMDAIAAAVTAQDAVRLAASIGNVLEQATLPLVPEIARLKAEMIRAGALGALMSGSGSAVFGIFASPAVAQAAKHHIKRQLSAQMPQLFLYAGQTCAPRRRDECREND